MSQKRLRSNNVNCVANIRPTKKLARAFFELMSRIRKSKNHLVKSKIQTNKVKTSPKRQKNQMCAQPKVNFEKDFFLKS